jgi:hypothetical protein
VLDGSLASPALSSFSPVGIIGVTKFNAACNGGQTTGLKTFSVVKIIIFSVLKKILSYFQY